MRKLAIAVALASTAIATPAVARNNSFYVGLEGGVMWVEDMDIDVIDGVTNPEYKVDHKTGYDVDAVAGYDFGTIRAEAEVAYKRARVDSVNGVTDVFEASGRGSAFSAMANVLLDFGDDDGWTGYIGGGLGLANVRYSIDSPDLPPFGDVEFSDSDSRLAWQVILGVRAAITPNLDLGLKYRFFNVSRLNWQDDFDAGQSGTIPVEVEGRWRSHSLLASLIYNFAAPPPPPPPPPPPAPATQTCPDGTVILATDACPAPPPPPPPPPPAPERG